MLEDFHLRGKVALRPREDPGANRASPGAAAHGVFEAYGTAASATKARFLAIKGQQTPVFVRLSTAAVTAAA